MVPKTVRKYRVLYCCYVMVPKTVRKYRVLYCCYVMVPKTMTMLIEVDVDGS